MEIQAKYDATSPDNKYVSSQCILIVFYFPTVGRNKPKTDRRLDEEGAGRALGPSPTGINEDTLPPKKGRRKRATKCITYVRERNSLNSVLSGQWQR